MRVIAVFVFLIVSAFAVSQEQGNLSRGSIPEELLRPRREESPRYPIDTVIGILGPGNASAAAYSFANSVASGLLSGQISHSALSGVNSGLRESYISVIEAIEPESFRIGGGREEADGAVSFLIRFIGREYRITGELFLRYVTRQIQGDGEEAATAGNWVFEELLLEEARSREEEQQEFNRYDFYPYERFF